MTLRLTRLLATAALALPLAARADEQAPASPPQFVANVQDPLLAPMPPPQKALKDWGEALALLRASSVDDRSALAGVERAEARWKQALAALLPNVRGQLGLGLDVLHPNAPGAAQGAGLAGTTPTSPLGSAQISATQAVIDLSAKRGVDSAEASTRSAQATVFDVRRRLTQGLARALVAVVAAERVSELNRLGLRQALERAALTQRTLELGAATQLDLVRVQQDVEVARGVLLNGDEQLRRTRDALGLALGAGADVGVIPGFQLGGLVEEAQAQCRALPGLDDRPDVVAQRELVQSAKEAERQANAGRLPTLGLATAVNAYTTDPGPARVANWNLSAVLSIPIWEGGLRSAVVAERAGATTQAEQALERTRRDVTNEVARTRRGVEVADALLKSAKEARALAVRLDELTRRAFEVGRSSSLELVQTASALRQADALLATREYERVQAGLDVFLTEARCDW